MKTEIMSGIPKGSLGLKSGPYAPTSAKLSSQYIVLDHMNNHYKKISQAKSAIDNRPPKSIGSSQKVRERKEREYIQKHGTSRPTSQMSVRSTSRHHYYDEDYNDANWEDPEDDDERLVYSIMRTTLKENHHGSADATQGSGSRQRGHSPANFNKTIRYQNPNQAALQTYYKQEQRPVSVRSNRSVMSAGSRTSLTGHTKPKTYDGDLLDKHSHVFREPEKPFTPRTLKSNRQSRLTEYKYYTPPPKNRKQSEEDREQTDKKMADTDTSSYRPKPKPRGTATLDRTGTLSESQLMYETLQSRDFRHERSSDDVPKLDISVDKDHMNWLKEQASKAKIRMKNGGVKAPMDQIEEGEKPTVNGGDAMQADTLHSTSGSARLTKSFGSKSMTRQRMSEADEEQKYVLFAKEVTEEVLNRGIYTDRVLKKVFDRYVEKYKGTLKISRMRAILDKLRLDFGVSDNPDPYTDDDEMTAVSTLEADPAVRQARLNMHHTRTSDLGHTADSFGQTLDQTDDRLQLDHTAKLAPGHHHGHGTMNSTDTLNFGSTGEAFSTLRSEHRRGSQHSVVRSEVDDRRSEASESRSTVGGRRSREGDRISESGDRKSEVSELRSEGRVSDAGLGGTAELMEAYRNTIGTKDMPDASRTASEADPSDKMSIQEVNGVQSTGELLSEPESSAMSSPSRASQPPVAPRRRRAERQQVNSDHKLPNLHREKVVADAPEEGEVTLKDQREVTDDKGKAEHTIEKEKIKEEEDYDDDDYEDDYDADDDHQISDDDF